MNVGDVYVIFRKSQSSFLSRPYRLPKDVLGHIENKFSDTNKRHLQKITDNFNTKWINIDPEKYFKYGFELFGKTFTYTKFFDPRLIQFYIMKDKNSKREMEINKKQLLSSAKFVKKFLNENEITLSQYCEKKDGELSLPILHYLNGKLDNIFLTLLIYKKFLRLTDYEREKIKNIISNYRKLVYNINNIDDFFNKLLMKL